MDKKIRLIILFSLLVGQFTNLILGAWPSYSSAETIEIAESGTIIERLTPPALTSQGSLGEVTDLAPSDNEGVEHIAELDLAESSGSPIISSATEDVSDSLLEQTKPKLLDNPGRIDAMVIDFSKCPIGLSGWPIVEILAQIVDSTGNKQVVSQDPGKPTVIPDFNGNKSIELAYKVDMEAFFKTDAGSWVKNELDKLVESQEVFFDFSFEMGKDIQMTSNVVDQEIKSGDTVIGHFDVIKDGGTDGNHLWKVQLNSDALLANNGWANMNFGSYVTLVESESEKTIMVSGDDRAEVEIYLEKEPAPYSLTKNTTGKDPKAVMIGDQEHHLLEWEVIVDLDKNKIKELTDLKLIDADITKFFEESISTHGFYFPSTAEHQKIKDEGFKVIEVTSDDGTSWVQGTDYVWKFTNDHSSTIEFKRPVSDKMKIIFTTISKDKHPSTITNQVTSTTKGLSSLTDTAEQTIHRHYIEKESINKGNGVVQWQIVYYRDHENEETFTDVLQAGVIDQSSLYVVNEKGESGEKLIKGEDYQVSNTADTKFDITFKAGLPKGRYIIYYESKHPSGESIVGLKNEFSGNGLSDIGIVSDDRMTVTKKVLSQPDDNGKDKNIGFRDKTILWQSTINTIADFGPIHIRDAAVREGATPSNRYGLNYEYDENIPGSKLSFDAEGIPSVESIKARGIIVTYLGTDSKQVLIPMEDLKVTMKNMGSKSDEGVESFGDAWTGTSSGFEMEVHQKYAGKQLQVYVSSKFGYNEEDETPIIPRENGRAEFVNSIEAKQEVGGREFYGYSSANTNNGELSSSTDAGKNGEFIPAFNVNPSTGEKELIPNEYMVKYHAVMNNNLYYLAKDDVFVDQLSRYGFGGQHLPHEVHYFDPADENQMLFYKMVLKDKGSALDPDEESLFQQYEKVPLKASEYELSWQDDFKGNYSGKYKQFTIKLKEDLGNVAIGMVVYTRFQKDAIANVAKNPSHGEITFNNWVQQTINKNPATASTSPKLTFKNNSESLDKQSYLIHEDGDSDKPVRRVGYNLTVNSQQAVYQNLEVEDIPNNQIIDFNTFQVRIGKNQFAKNVIETVVDEAKEPLVLGTHYTLEKSGEGFKIKMLGQAFEDGVINFPFLISYEAIPTASLVTNTASYQHSETITITDKSEQIIQIASGEGGFDYSLIKLTKHEFEKESELLSGAEFTLERWNSSKGVYQEVKTDVTDVFGDLTFDKLTKNKYRIKETKAPAGYTSFDEYVYFELDENGLLVGDAFFNEKGEQDKEIDTYYNVKTDSGNQKLYLVLTGNKQSPLSLEGNKVLNPLDKLPKDQNFTFEIQETTSEKVVALGKVTLKPEHQVSGEQLRYQEKINFYPVDDKGVVSDELITDWPKVLKDNTEYRLVEKDSQGYQVAYQLSIDGQTTTSPVFVTDFSKKMVLDFTVTNTEQQAREDYVLPDAGGIPNQLSLLLGSSLIVAGFLYGMKKKKAIRS